jgi:hypothetical protein
MALVLVVDDADIRDLATVPPAGLSTATLAVDDSVVPALVSRARA